jgi:hypothetical protein
MTAGVSALTAGIGVAGGVVLGRTALQRYRKVLGIPVPRKVDVDFGNVSRGIGDVAQQIGEAGRQFGRLAGEVQAVRRKAEQVGAALK